MSLLAVVGGWASGRGGAVAAVRSVVAAEDAGGQGASAWRGAASRSARDRRGGECSGGACRAGDCLLGGQPAQVGQGE